MEGPPPRTLRLLVEYDGTEFAGWQRQAGQRTVQGCLEEAFFALTAAPVAVRGAGRTDSGVHADGQVASARVVSGIPAGGFLRGLNTRLPADVAVLDVRDAPPDFDARLAARGKVYRYLVWNHLVRSPRHHRDSWHHKIPLDVSAMREAAAVFVGEHDFRAFRSSHCDRRSTVRTIRACDVWRQGALITCEIEGTAFLRNMVRIMVGTLTACGRGKIDADGVRRLLAAGDRAQAGVTAPAHGLTLVRVVY